jgi:hypothetical protein
MKASTFRNGPDCFGVSLFSAQAPSTVTYVDHDKVATTSPTAASWPVGPDFAMSVAKRTAPGQVEIHDKETDTFYILEEERQCSSRVARWSAEE